MNLVSIQLRDYRSWKALDWTPPEGTVAILGENGAGKSSILSALETALFGGRLEPLLRHGGERLEVTVVFEHEGERYRIRRTLAGGRSALDFERWAS